MATTGHELEAINVQGLKASLQKFKTDKVDVKSDKSSTVSTVSYSSKKIQKTINGTTTDVVSADTLKSDMALNNVTNDAQVKRTEMGAASGVATLNASGKVPVGQIPVVSEEWVDLGLPSGLLWRSCNIGADAPEEAGLYFSWGNVEGHTATEGYSFDQTTYNSTSGASLTGNIPVNATYDAAQKYLGGDCRLPSKTEFEELIANTTSQWTTINGVNGRLFTATNGKSIFIPTAGYFSGSSRSNFGTGGYYWSSTFYGSNDAYEMDYDADDIYVGDNGRKLGLSVRPVSPTIPMKKTVPQEEYENDQKAVAAAINEVGTKVIETTWAELRAWRDHSMLIPGMWYQIIDHEPSGWEWNIAEGHAFDILVQATGKDTLSEVAKAKARPFFSANVRLFKTSCGYSKEGPDYDEPFYYVGTFEYDGETYYRWQKHEDNDPYDGEHYVLTTQMFHVGDLSADNYCNSYIELTDDNEYSGMESQNDVFVLCEESGNDIIIYKTSLSAYRFEPDYDEWYEPDGTMTFDGETYYRWKKWEDNAGEYSGYYALTDKIYYPGDIDINNPATFISINDDGEEYGSGMDDIFVESEYYGTPEVDYFADKGINGWQILFSLDNDIERFPWVTDDNNGVVYGVNYGNGYEKNGLKDYGLGKYKPVDLHLILNDIPLLFADKNIGADKPTDAGLYFSWGNIEGYKARDGYDFRGSYNNGVWSGPYSRTRGADVIVDIPAGAAYDAARALCGGHWRLPTQGEFTKLIDSADNEFIEQDGVNGVLFSDAGGGNGSIFIPAVGSLEGADHSDFGAYGYYWSSTNDGSTADVLNVGLEGAYVNENNRYYGFSVRPIYDNSYIDLGLPSGAKWATCNIGAYKPEDEGKYFSWGNIVGHTATEGYNFNQTTYNGTSGAGLSGDIPTNATYDAARAIRGGIWRLPTKKDFEELKNTDYTEWRWTSRNGKMGYHITSKINGMSIFIPAAGYFGGASRNFFGTSGGYWSSTFGSSYYAYELSFGSGSIFVNNNSRYYGFPVRPVKF